MKPVRSSATRSRPGTSPKVLERALCVRQRQRQALRGSQGSLGRSRPPVAKGDEGDGGDCKTAVPPRMTSTRQAACSAMGS
jgi:hypothetical protein